MSSKEKKEQKEANVCSMFLAAMAVSPGSAQHCPNYRYRIRTNYE